MNESNSEYLDERDLASELAKIFNGVDLKILKMRYGLGEYKKCLGYNEIASVVGLNVEVVKGRILLLLKGIKVEELRDGLGDRINSLF